MEDGRVNLETEQTSGGDGDPANKSKDGRSVSDTRQDRQT